MASLTLSNSYKMKWLRCLSVMLVKASKPVILRVGNTVYVLWSSTRKKFLNACFLEAYTYLLSLIRTRTCFYSHCVGFRTAQSRSSNTFADFRVDLPLRFPASVHIVQYSEFLFSVWCSLSSSNCVPHSFSHYFCLLLRLFLVPFLVFT